MVEIIICCFEYLSGDRSWDFMKIKKKRNSYVLIWNFYLVFCQLLQWSAIKVPHHKSSSHRLKQSIIFCICLEKSHLVLLNSVIKEMMHVYNDNVLRRYIHNAEILIVKGGGAYSCHSYLMG
jgi:hypothetical protein